jgi:hypothetical protein
MLFFGHKNAGIQDGQNHNEQPPTVIGCPQYYEKINNPASDDVYDIVFKIDPFIIISLGKL